MSLRFIVPDKNQGLKFLKFSHRKNLNLKIAAPREQSLSSFRSFGRFSGGVTLPPRSGQVRVTKICHLR